MILIDDNANEGIDFRNISNKVYEILAGIIDITKNNTQEVLKSQGTFSKIESEYNRRNISRKLDTQLDNFLKTDVMDNIKNNIIGYVLYDFNTKTKKEVLGSADYISILREVTSKVVGPSISKKIDDGLFFQMTREEYEEAKENIINRAIEETQKISTDDQDEIKSNLLEEFNSPLNNILPADIKAERSTIPKYTDTSHLVDGTLVRNLATGWIGKLVNVDQIDGVTKIEYEGKGKTGNTSLQFILNKSKFDLL
jgi:hypothetical protein